MQSRYYHELDHLRNASQRPQPSRSLDRPSLTTTVTSPTLRTHTRTQSAANPDESTTTSDAKGNPFYFDRNGGWLEPSAPVQLTASISSPSFPHPNLQYPTTPSTTQNIRATAATQNIENGHIKGKLGAVSNEHILKLTHLTNQLPEVSRKHNHIQKGPKQGKQRSYFEDDSLQVPDLEQQHYNHPNDIPNNSQITDTGFADLLNQDFIKSSSPASGTIISGNPSALSTDTDDSQFSFQHNNRSKHTTIGFEAPPAESTRSNNQHTLTITTTSGIEPNLTPSSSQDSRSNRRSWYKTLMKRDKKGKAKFDDTPMTNNDEQALDTNYDGGDSDPIDTKQRHPFLRQELTKHTIHNNYEFTNQRSQTHPMVDPTTNNLIPSSPTLRKRHTHLSIRRLRLPSRHKQTTGKNTEPPSHKAILKNGNDTTQESHATAGSKRSTRGTNRDRKLRLRLYSRRHSFDNMREYDMVPGGTPTTADNQADTTPNSINMDRLNSQHNNPPSSMSSSSSPPRPTSIPPSNIPTTIYQTDTAPWSVSSIIPSVSASSPAHDATFALAMGISKPDVDDLSSIDGSYQQDTPDFSETDPALLKQHYLSQMETTNEGRLVHDNSPMQQEPDQQPRPLIKKVLYFDYDSLPGDNKSGEPKGIKALVKAMIDNGYGTMTERIIRPDEDDEDDEEIDEDEENGKMDDDDDEYDDNKDDIVTNDTDFIPIIESSKVITGDTYYSWTNINKHLMNLKTKTRQIAEIHVDEENDLGFIKLSQLTDESSPMKGDLLNLYVSFLAPNTSEDDLALHIQDSSILCKNVNDRLLSLDPFIDNAKAFLKERKQEYRAFVPIDDTSSDIQQQQRVYRKQSDTDSGTGVRFASTETTRSSSIPSTQQPLDSTLSLSSLASTVRPASLSSSHRSGSSNFQQSLWNYVPYQEYNAYEYRQDQLKDAVSDLRRGIDDFKRSLLETEEMVHGVQIDMNDTKAKMDTYLKDVPETHYSELKRLEISIESILANRAKSRGMELLYWLLTALLTGCAFLLWAIICVLKLGQTAISFPRKMFRAFNEHMEERNKVVKQAGMRIVAKGADRPPSVSSSSRNSLAPPMEQPPSVPHPLSNRRRSSRRTSIPNK